MEVKLVGTGGIFSPLNSACAIINKHILIDIPNGSLKAMRRNGICITGIDTIFITHLHGDHYFDIPFLLLEKYKDDKNELTIVGPENAKNNIENITALAFPYAAKKIFKNIKINYIVATEGLVVDNITFSSLPMRHGMEAYGYILKEDKFKLGFTGDTAICDSVNKMLNECNKVVIDSTFEVGTNTHLGINEILMLLKKYPNTTLIPTHMGKKEKKILSFQSFDNLEILDDMSDVDISKK